MVKLLKNKFANQYFFGPNIALFEKKYLAVHIITYIYYYENSTKSSKLRIINNSQIYSAIIDTMGQIFSSWNIVIIIFCHLNNDLILK
jgi:hypothetical protein